jgi:hypothetical protein
MDVLCHVQKEKEGEESGRKPIIYILVDSCITMVQASFATSE